MWGELQGEREAGRENLQRELQGKPPLVSTASGRTCGPRRRWGARGVRLREQRFRVDSLGQVGGVEPVVPDTPNASAKSSFKGERPDEIMVVVTEK